MTVIFSIFSKSISEALLASTGRKFFASEWQDLEVTAIEKFDIAYQLGQGYISNLRDPAPQQLKEDFENMKMHYPEFLKARKTIESFSDPTFDNLKSNAIRVFDLIDEILMALSDTVEGGINSYRVSQNTLSREWSKPENDHWDDPYYHKEENQIEK